LSGLTMPFKLRSGGRRCGQRGCGSGCAVLERSQLL
jgi:hypothetical protein